MAANVTIYPFPRELPASTDCRLWVNDAEVFVHQTDVGSIASFAIDGAVDVRIEWQHDVGRAVVRPLSRQIAPAVDSRTVRLQVSEPGALSVEINGDIRKALLLFIDPPETDAPAPDAPGVRFFEGGKIHEAGEIQLKTGDTLYLGPGAVVRGTIRAENAENIRIAGRGMLDARTRTTKTQFVRLSNCRNVIMSDVIVLGSFGWTLVPWGCETVRFENVKVFSWRDNDDGLDICSCRSVVVKDCFFRTKDDCIAIKAPRGDRSGTHDVETVRVEGSVFWNAEWGNAMEIGFELQTPTVRSIVWHDCDIIHVESGSVFSIHNGDWADVEDVLFENIRVEDAREKLVDLRVGLSIYSDDCPERYHRSNPERKQTGAGQWVPPDALTEDERETVSANRGSIRRVCLRDVDLLENVPPKSYIVGFGEYAGVEDVAFINLRHRGKALLSASAANVSVDAAEKIRLEAAD